MLSLIVALSLQGAASAQASDNKTIVVIGQRIANAQKDLKACIARNCRTDEDIDATLRLAEIQLLAGKYRDARKTLLASLSRNKEEGRAYPIPVSDLYRANGKVAAHLGLDKDYYNSTWGIYRTLKDGLPSEDHRRFSALMEVAEMMYRTRGHERARYYYDEVAAEARKAGREDIAALAQLRSAIRHLPPGSSMQIMEIEKIANLQGPKMRAPVLEAKVALARIAYSKGDEATAAGIQRELAALNIKKPILIFSPPYSMVQRELNSGSEFNFPFAPPPSISGDGSSGGGGGGLGPGALASAPSGGNPNGLESSNRGSITSILALSQWSQTKRMAGNFDDMWADIGFRITPEGKVSDVEIVRSKGDLSWSKPLLASIKLRRYTAAKTDHPSSRIVERYTYTSGYEAQTGTRTAQRSPKARVEYVDLSDISAAE